MELGKEDEVVGDPHSQYQTYKGPISTIMYNQKFIVRIVFLEAYLIHLFELSHLVRTLPVQLMLRQPF